MVLHVADNKESFAFSLEAMKCFDLCDPCVGCNAASVLKLFLERTETNKGRRDDGDDDYCFRGCLH